MINIKKLGPISTGNINLNKMTVFIGEGGSGKTYASYAIYGIHEFLVDELRNTTWISEAELKKLLKTSSLEISITDIQEKIIKKTIQNFEKNSESSLAKTFNISKKAFSETKILIDEKVFPKFDIRINRLLLSILTRNLTFKTDGKIVQINVTQKERILYFNVSNYSNEDIIESDIKNINTATEKINIALSKALRFPNLVYIPAERVGLHVFRDELNRNRLDKFNDLSMILNDREQKMNITNLEIPTYPKPISSYLSNLNNWFNIKQNGLKRKQNQDLNTLDLINGKFEIDDNNHIFFREKYGEARFKKQEIPFQVASSTLKSLFGFDLYLNHGINSGDYLVIDEPELNLHLNGQKKLAKLLYQLPKHNVHVILSTHSDYLLKELINLELTESLEKKEMVNDISCLHFSENTIIELENLKEKTYIDNFDNFYAEVESEYYTLIKKLRRSINHE